MSAAGIAQHARAQLRAPDLERLAVEDAGRAAQRRREHAERRARAHRIAAPEPDLDRLAALA